jgi:hypothetical protein
MQEYLKSPRHESNRESNGTDGDDTTIRWWSFTDLARGSLDVRCCILRSIRTTRVQAY